MYDGYTRTCGLIGNPVEHTISPLIHNYLAEKMEDNLVYVPFHVPQGQVEEAVKGVFALNLLGCNVTVPYKSEVIPYLEQIDPLAQRIGAVNTLVRQEKGFKGYNTDMPGLYRALERDGVKIQGAETLILGAGGVARAVAILLAEKGASRIVILNRSVEKAFHIAQEVNGYVGRELVEVLPLTEYRKLTGSYLVIQATSVGMYPRVDEVVIDDPDFYKLIHTGYDLIYNPQVTRFVQLVRQSGGKAYNGLGMLLYQGVIAYELWTGKAVSDELADKVYDKMVEAMGNKNLVMMGFMGSGKTSVGMELSYLRKSVFVDTDQMIEEREGKSISEIFATEGEEAFRDKETKLLKELAGSLHGKILSVGGGTPLREENRRLLKEIGTVIYLRICPETVYERLKSDNTRPLLQCENPLERICALLEQRKEVYEDAADVVVDVDGLTMEEVISIIQSKITSSLDTEEVKQIEKGAE
ncbi:MAG: shikimate dehydrogenase [Lachnospiraceae bacterium]|nr:shikimate dehydrogenase [Lachnospiraceae bacterium]